MEDRVVAGVQPPQSGQVTDLRSGGFGIGGEGELRTSSSAAGLGRLPQISAPRPKNCASSREPPCPSPWVR
jgi:hypothetical protein